MNQPKPIDLFTQQALARLPGFLYSFNIADFKRRNGHLGHLVGDADIAELDRRLKEFASNDGLVARTSGDRWFLLTRDNRTEEVGQLLAAYAREEPIEAGWEIIASRRGRTKSDRR